MNYYNYYYFLLILLILIVIGLSLLFSGNGELFNFGQFLLETSPYMWVFFIYLFIIHIIITKN